MLKCNVRLHDGLALTRNERVLLKKKRKKKPSVRALHKTLRMIVRSTECHWVGGRECELALYKLPAEKDKTKNKKKQMEENPAFK